MLSVDEMQIPWWHVYLTCTGCISSTYIKYQETLSVSVRTLTHFSLWNYDLHSTTSFHRVIRIPRQPWHKSSGDKLSYVAESPCGKSKGKHSKQQHKFAWYLLTILEQKAQKLPGFRHALLNLSSNAFLSGNSRTTTSHLKQDEECSACRSTLDVGCSSARKEPKAYIK